MYEEIGVRFALQGASSALTSLRDLGGGFRALSGTVDSSGSAIGGKMQVMAAGIKKAAIVASASLAGLGAAAVAIPTKLAFARSELTRTQADLRALGKTDTDIADFEKAAGDFTRKVAGITKDAWTAAAYDIVSAFADESTAAQAKVNDIAMTMAKATKMQAVDATKLLGSLWGASGDEIRKAGAEQFSERWASAIYTAVKELKTTGPELQAAAKNSMSVLMEAGWSPEMMATFWGSLITAGLSGEQAGTALKQLGLKERKAFGEIVAQADERFIDTKDLSEKAKKRAEAWNEGLIAGAGKAGAQLFKTDQLKWIDKIGEAVERMKARGVDYKQVLAKAFGEESVNAILSFLGKRGQLKETLNKIAKGSYGDVRRVVEDEMSKGIGPASDILGNIWKGLKGKIGGMAEPMLINMMKRIGNALISLTEWVEPRAKALSESLISFGDAFGTAFSQTAQKGEELSGIISRIVNLLDKPSAEEFRQLGVELGTMAATSMDSLVSGLSDVRDAIREIAGLAKSATNTLADWGLIGKKTQATASEASPVAQGPTKAGMGGAQAAADQQAASGSGGLLRPLGGLWLGSKFGPWGALAGLTAGTMWAYPEARPSEKSPIVGPLIDTFKDSFNIFEKSRNVAKNMQNIYRGVIDNKITVETSPTVNVKVGDRQLDAIIEEKVQREHARHRQGYGDTALAEPGR